MEYVFVGGEYQGTAGEGAGGECRCRCGFKSELTVGRDEERDRLVDDGINVGIEALATHSQIITHLPYHHVGQKHHPLQETSARARFNPPKGPFSVSTTKPVPQRPAPTAKIHVGRASLYTRFMVSSSLTFHVQPILTYSRFIPPLSHCSCMAPQLVTNEGSMWRGSLRYDAHLYVHERLLIIYQILLHASS